MQHSEPLARLERDLRVPPQRRLELLEELDADLSALSLELESRGFQPQRARDVAMRRLFPEGDVVAHLEVEHEASGARWLRQHRWLTHVERAALVLVAMLSTAGTLWVVRQAGGVTSSRLLVVLEVLIIAALGLNWTRTAFRLWVRRDLRPDTRLAHWRLHVGLIVASVAVGALGGAWEGYALLSVNSATGETAVSIWSMIRSALALVTLGMAAAVFGLFGWVSLMPRITTDDRIEKRIAEFFRRRPTDFDTKRR